MNRITGLAGARGQVLLPATVLVKQAAAATQRTVAVPEDEVARFQEIQQIYIEDLGALYEKTLAEVGSDAADIINAYRVIAKDTLFFSKPLGRVRTEGINADFAIAEACDKVCRKFSAMPDPYLQERANDIRNVCDELIRRLNGVTSSADTGGEGLSIIVAEDLTPEDTVRIDKSRLGGFITARGGVTSHAVILAKTLGIPAVVGAVGIMEAVRSGEQIYLNGDEGWALVAPDEAATRAFTAARTRQETRRARYDTAAQGPAVTLDGHKVAVCVNSGDSDSIQSFRADCCDGVGLFRTEFLFMGQTDYPDEELQYQTYRTMAEAACGKEVIIRTLDIGGDKQLDYMDMPKESNPFLGYRAIRLCLDREPVFLTQLRAILRAAVHGNIKIMFPMIVTLEELRRAKELVAQAEASLAQEGVPYGHDVPLGIMVETPAAVLLSDVLAEECAFFSIGTNDLIQYTTATDRMNERVQYLYSPYNLSVLRAIHTVIESGHRAGIPVGMCGEVASDEQLLPLLLAMGLDEFSVVPAQVGKVKHLIQRADFGALAPLPGMILSQREIAEGRRILAHYAICEED